MQQVEKSKETPNALAENYGPLGPRHLLAAALAMQCAKPANEDAKKTEKPAFRAA